MPSAVPIDWRKVPAQRILLTITAVTEALTGVAFLLAPGAVTDVLLGAEPDAEGLMIGRVAGAALLAVGISCWGGGRDGGGAAREATLTAALLYNFGAGGLLVLFSVTGQADSFGAWAAGVLHLILAVGFAAARRTAGAHPQAAGERSSVT